METGRVCVKTAGREASRMCVILDVVDENHVLVSGPEVRRRRCNIKHLEPLEHKLEIDKDASDEDVNRSLEAEGLMKIVKSPERLPKPKEKPPKKAPPKKEVPKKPPEKKKPEKVERAGGAKG